MEKTKSFTSISKALVCLMLIALMFTALVLNGALKAGVQAASMPEADERKEVDIWLIGGQSNAVGYGEVSAYPTDAGYAEDKAMLTAGSQNVWFYGKDEGIGNDPTEFVPSGFGLGQTTGRSGAEIGITTALNGNGRMNAIIKLAYGSSYVYPNTGADISIKRGTWTSPSYIEKHGVNVSGNKTGDLYWAFLNTVEEGLRQLTEKGYTPIIRGMWWMQGEAETFNATTSSAYEECLTYFINDIRASLSELSGTDCSAMPFVLGRLYRNPDQPHSAPQYLAAVQAGQDAVAANESLKNVFKVDGATDLIDPASGEQVLPKQQDGWHFDALTQQMLGEAFVAKATSVGGELTKYGYIPTDYASATTYPLALFKATDSGYEFLKGYGSWKQAFEAAVAQTTTAAPKTEEAVLLLRRDFESTEISQHGGNVTSSITVDLNGYTFAAKASFTNTKTADNFSGVTEETLRNGSVTVKNGRLLVGSFGLLYTAKNGTLTVDKEITYNFEDLYLGFAEGATSTKLLVQAASTHTNKNVTYNVNVTNCTVDMVTNAPAGAILGSLNTGTSCMSDHVITFRDCDFIADKVSKLSVTASAEGDSVRYEKGANGYFGVVTVPDGGEFSFTAEGIEGGNTVTVSAKATTAESGAVYALVASGSVTTAYAPIPQNYADAAAYPFAVFSKTEGGYSFVGAYNNWQPSMNKAIALTHGASGTTEEAVILLRADHVTSQTVYNTSDIGTVVTVDLGGHTLTAKGSFCNTKTDDYITGLTPETVKSGTINVKNGSLLMGAHGILYSAKNGTYTVEKSLTFNFSNVYIGYCEGATSKTLLARAYDSHSGINTVYNMNFTDCVIDLETNAPEGTVIGDLEADKNCYSDHNITFGGCTFITEDVKKMLFVKSTEGDSVTFIKDESGEYPKLLLRSNTAEPDGTVVFDTAYGGQVMPTETADTEGLYKICVFSEVLSSKYGVIPNAYSDSVFTVFTNTGNGYLFDSAHNGWNAAMGRAITLTHAATGTAKEAVVLLMKDHKTTELLKNTFAIGSTVTVDLGGNTLTVCTSFCNTQTADYSGVTAANTKNGTINVKNGTLLVRDFGLVYTAMGSGSYNVPRTLYMNYEDLTIGFSDDCENGKDINLLTHAYGGSAAVRSGFVFTYKNCVFDMVTNTTSASRLGRAQTVISGTTESSNTAFELTFDANCVFKVYDPAQISFTTKSASGDTIEFEADASGNYAKILIPAAAQPAKYPTVLENTTGIALGLQYASTENGYDVYELYETEKPEDVVTPYGTIPAQYSNAEAYPFVYFDGNGNFKGAYSLFYGANGVGGVIGEAKTYLRDANVFDYDKQQYNSPVATAYILMRRDYTMDAAEYHDNNAQVQGVMNIDLGGYTLYQNKRVLFPSCAKGWSGSGDAKIFHTTFAIRNGGIALKDNYLAELSAWDSTGDGAIVNKNYTHVFENVRFSLVQGATVKGLIRHSVNNATPTAVTTFFFSFNDCEFDLKTAAPVSGFTLFTASHDYIKTVYTFTGCEITADSLENVVFTNITNGSATAIKNADGKYLTIILNENAPAPNGNFITAEGEKLVVLGGAGSYTLGVCTHSYDSDFDANCNVCGEAREITATEGEVSRKIFWAFEDGVLTVTGRGKIKNFSGGITPWSHLADKITKVVIGEGITYIGSSSFYCCANIESVELPESLTAMGNYVFYGCSSLKAITIPEAVTEIGKYSFRRSGLETIDFAIGYGWSAGDREFSIADITSGGHRFISKSYYKQTWVRNVEAEVETLDPSYVAGGIMHTDVIWELTYTDESKTNMKLTIRGNGAMADFGTAGAPWYAYWEQITEIEIQEGVTTVGRCAFYGLKFVRKATVADSVTAIGDYGFYMCRLMKEITLPEGITVGKDAFVKTGVTV